MWCYVAPADVAAATVAAVTYETDFDIFFVAAPNTLCAEPTLDRLRARWGKLPELRQPEFYAADPTAGLYDNRKARESWGLRRRETGARCSPKTRHRRQERLPMTEDSARPMLIRGGVVLDAAGWLGAVDILIVSGIIAAVVQPAWLPPKARWKSMREGVFSILA